MGKVFSSRIFWGIGLVIGGVLLLLDTFGIIKSNALFWSIASALVGLFFLSVFIKDRENWWALIPGIIFMTIAVAIALDAFLPGFNNANLAGPVILAGIALSFFFIYAVERANWWALIPAGVMSTISIVAVLDSNNLIIGSAGIFFLGLGATFVLVAVLPNSIGPMRWAWIPAIVLGLMGILIILTAVEMINYIWPAALILVGLILVWRSIRSRK